MKFARPVALAASVFAFAGCATMREPPRRCTLDSWQETMRGLKSMNAGLSDEDPLARLQAARGFSDAVENIGCTESSLRGEMQMMDMAKYAILDASIGLLGDKDVSVRLAACDLIADLVINRGVKLDSLSFRALSTGLGDESPDVREKVAQILAYACIRQPRLCPAEPEPATLASR
ncbi:MAG: hypothetical protein AB1324_05945 [Candidatus Micrarchaeota archaeon]